MRDEFLESLISKYEKRLESKQADVSEYETSEDVELRTVAKVLKVEIKEIEYILRGLYWLR